MTLQTRPAGHMSGRIISVRSEFDGVEIGGKDDLQHFAILGVVQNGMLDLIRLSSMSRAAW